MEKVKQFREFFKKATGNEPYPYQARLALSDKLPHILEIPTGAGKTASVVLSWLWRLKNSPESTSRRLVYCLPMRVLVEQTFDEIQEWLKKLGFDIDIKVNKLLGGDCDRDWAYYPERASVFVGTQDMLLSRALNRGFGSTMYRWPREFGFLNNDCLWVIDEVQLMGSGLFTTSQLQAFRDMLGAFGNNHTIWMSATIMEEWLKTVDFTSITGREKLNQDDLEFSEFEKRVRCRKTIEKARANMGDSAEIAGEAMERFDQQLNCQNMIIVVNTVKRACEIYDNIKKKLKSTQNKPDLILLHSHFRSDDRNINLQKALKKTETRKIIISTQVIEAGVDISSSILFTDIAPVASLVQRFGRCNRRGECENSGGKIFWFDAGENELKKYSAPYTEDEMKDAREILNCLTDVSPDALSNNPLIKDKMKIPQGMVLRKKDLMELFDTTPDLAGLDVDISRFVRETTEYNINVFWRNFDEKNPPVEKLPSREEICPAPFMEVKDVLKKQNAWRYDFIEGNWKEASAEKITPGMTLMFHCNNGHYNEEIGWNKGAKNKVKPVNGNDEEINNEESYSFDSVYNQSGSQTIREHTDKVCERTIRIINELGYLKEFRSVILNSARWHDAGKAHEVFQEAVYGDENAIPGNHLAKSDKSMKKYMRKYFRHELVSGILALQNGLDDLTAYLCASHHGKVRLSIRSLPDENEPGNNNGKTDENIRFARGVWDNDRIPEVDLGGGVTVPETYIKLNFMDLGYDEKTGESWLSRTLRLRDDENIGPFRLALMESILRAADERASGGME